MKSDDMTTATTATETTQVYEVVTEATPEQIWDALTKPELTQQYFYGSVFDSTFEPGTPYVGWAGDRSRKFVEGEVLEADPPYRLSTTWRSLWNEEAAAEQPSRVTWEIEPQEGGGSKVTLVHDKLEESPKTAESVAGGWNSVLGKLKAFIETGQPQLEEA
jgi:uncharacterized protein YndB with AHSA1/START domain